MPLPLILDVGYNKPEAYADLIQEEIEQSQHDYHHDRHDDRHEQIQQDIEHCHALEQTEFSMSR